MRAVAAAAVVACGAALAAPARALEGEQRVGVDLGGAMLVQQGKTTADIGPAAGAHWAYGLSDAFDLTAEGGWSLLSTSAPQGASVPRTLPGWAANADVGISYILDVMQWVPYVGVMVGGYAFAGGTIDGARIYPGAAIALGLDYRVRPGLLAGVAVRQHFVSDVSAYPSFTQVFARVEYAWGW